MTGDVFLANRTLQRRAVGAIAVTVYLRGVNLIAVYFVNRQAFDSRLSDEENVIAALSHESIHEALNARGVPPDEHDCLDNVARLNWPVGRDGITFYRQDSGKFDGR